MSIYNIDFKKLTSRLLPPDKRGAFMRNWVYALAVPLQWLRDLVLGDYKSGATYAPYSDANTYSKYERVIYRYSVYESLVNNNLANDPLNVSYWQLVQENFVGVDERIKYNGNALELTNALNKYFGTVFRQPPNTSDIFLTAHFRPQSVFVVGGSASNSSVVYRNRSSEFVINSYTFAGFVNLTINVPVAVFEALDDDPTNREPIIRNFADRYIVAGIIYEVTTY